MLRNETITRTFGAVEVELHFFEEGGEQRCMGDVILRHENGLDYHGSLDRLIGLGTLETDACGAAVESMGEPFEVEIPDDLIDDIAAWAYEEGY